MWDFIYLKTWFNQVKFVYPIYCPCGKIHKSWLEKENILCIILGDIGLCNKNKFDQRVSFFDHLRQKALCGSIIHYKLMQYLHKLYPDDVECPPKKVSPFMNIEFHETNFKSFCIQKFWFS